MTVRKFSSTMPMRVLIPLLVGICGTVVLTVFTVYQLHKTVAEVEEEARHDLVSIMSSLQDSVNYLLRRNDMVGVQTMLTNEGVHDYIKYLALVDHAGTILIASRSAANGLPLHSTIPELVHVFTTCRNGKMVQKNILGFDGTHLLGCYPVISLNRAGLGDSQSGYLLVSYDFGRRKTLGDQRATRLAVLVWSLFAAGFVLLVVLLRYALARRRIALVLSATEKIAAGDLTARVKLRGGDELATISQAFDRMADQLQATTHALETSRAQLEEKVEERTAELARTNKRLEREIFVRIQAEQVARRDGDWLRSLIETSQDAVISIDRQAQIVLFNPSAEQIFGYTAEEVAGKKIDLLMAEPYTWESGGTGSHHQQTDKARAGQTRLLMAKRKNGEQFPIEVSLTEVAADKDVPYAAFIRDVSEKSRLQAQLVESERLAAIGTTAAKIGHEIANPLNGMYLTVQLLEQRLARGVAESDGQVAANIKKLRDEIGRLNQLVQQFRALARRDKFEFRPLRVADLIEDVVTVQQPLFASLGIEIELCLATDLPPINADRDKLKQAMLNLLKNSIEAMPGGGKIKISGSATSDMVTIEITDTGTGIPPDIDIFQPFVTTKNQGTGLGLVIVRQIVTGHHGAVSYHSEVGKGTKFLISLPRI